MYLHVQFINYIQCYFYNRMVSLLVIIYYLAVTCDRHKTVRQITIMADGETTAG